MKNQCYHPCENKMSYRLFKICFVAPLLPQFGGKGYSSGGIGYWARMVCNYAENLKDIRITEVNTTPRWRAIYNFSICQRDLEMYLSHAVNRLIYQDYSAEAFAETLQRATIMLPVVREEMRHATCKEVKRSFDFISHTVLLNSFLKNVLAKNS